MADRTIKPDDTHDLVLQNNDGSAKIEVNEAQTVVLTGGSTAALTIDTDGYTQIASGKRIETDEVRAQGASGLKLYEDGGAGIFVEDGGNVGIGTASPSVNYRTHITGATSGSNSGIYIESFDSYGLFVNGTGTETAHISGYFNASGAATTNTALYTSATNATNNYGLIVAAGDVGIGETSPSHILHISAQGRSTNSAWATSSDGRVKENIVPHEDSLILINQLKPKRFNFKSAYRPDAPESETGFIAQDFESVFPEAVTTIEREEWITEPAKLDDEGEIIKEEVKDGLDDFKILNTSCLLPMLVKAVQELSANVNALENA